VAALAVGLVVAALALPAGAEPSFSTPGALPTPAGAVVKGSLTYSALSCVDATDCVAVGPQEEGFFNTSGSATTLASGTWSTPSSIAMPANAETTASTRATSLDDVSCWAVGDCVAVGDYTIPEKLGKTSYPTSEPMVVMEVSGVWSTAVQLYIPTTLYVAGETDSVSCDAEGDCTVAGWYVTVNSTGTVNTYHAFTDTELAASGSWGSLNVLPSPTGADLNIYDAFVSCTDATDCTVAYVAQTGSGKTLSLFTDEATETAGSWPSVPTLLAGPAGSPFNVTSLDCVDAADCVAVGGGAPTASDLENGVDEVPTALSESAGTWHAQRLALPLLSPELSQGYLTSVSCWAVGDCEAVGVGLVGATGIAVVPVAVNLSTGSWSSLGIDNAALPAGKVTATQSEFVDVACLTDTDCVATLETSIGAVSANEVDYGYTVNVTPVATTGVPGKVGAVKVTGVAKSMTVAYAAPTHDGGSPITAFVATAKSSGEPTKTCTTKALTCSVTGVVAGHVYKVTVVARNAKGSSIASTVVAFKQP
jgi:hypothetical protein